jgi:DNA invertase Pin-like site-specific DNA recombinase
MSVSPVSAGCYVRVSKQDQNPEHQRAEMERLRACRGWQPRWYVEKMQSTRNNQPDFARMVADALTGQLGAVVVWTLDRLGRDQVFMLTSRPLSRLVSRWTRSLSGGQRVTTTRSPC